MCVLFISFSFCFILLFSDVFFVSLIYFCPPLIFITLFCSALISLFLSLFQKSVQTIKRTGSFLNNLWGMQRSLRDFFTDFVEMIVNMSLKCRLLRLLETSPNFYYFHGCCDLFPEDSRACISEPCLFSRPQIGMCADLLGAGNRKNILVQVIISLK
jgi:hypothetical protein